MMRTILALAATAGLTLSLVSGSLAQPAPPKEIKCDVCDNKMTLTTKKDATHTQAVKIKGKTYYCCAGCDMTKSKLVDKKKP
jgi:hypothetical protein